MQHPTLLLWIVVVGAPCTVQTLSRARPQKLLDTHLSPHRGHHLRKNPDDSHNTLVRVFPGDSVPFLAGQAGYDVYRIPATVIHPATGELLVFAEGRYGTGHDDGAIDIVCRTSHDLGQSWGELSMVVGDGPSHSNTFGNPVPIVDSRAGKVHLIYTLNNTFVMKVDSIDGLSWSRPVNLTESLRRQGWGWIGTGPGHGIMTENGKMIVPFNRKLAKHTDWMEFLNVTDEGQLYDMRGLGKLSRFGQLHVHGPNPGEDYVANASVDHITFIGNAGVFAQEAEQPWGIAGLLTRLGSDENQIAELSTSELLMSFRVHSSFAEGHCRLLASSQDGGRTWSEPWTPQVKNVTGVNCIPDPGCQGSLLALPPFSSCPRSQDLLIASGPGSTHTKTGRGMLTLWISEDKGLTFTRFAHISKATNTDGYSDIVLLSMADCVATLGVLYEAVPAPGGTLAFARVTLPL